MKNKKLIQKFVSVSMFCGVMLSSLPVSVLAEDGRKNIDEIETGNEEIKSDFNAVLHFAVNPETEEARIIDLINKDEAKGRLVLPDTVFYMGKEYNIAIIDIKAFENCYGLTDVVIPGNIKSIAYSAFSNCINLKNVVIKEGVESIYMEAFAGCVNLKNVTIPSSIVRIDSKAFFGSDFDNIVLPVEVEDGFVREWHYLSDNKPFVEGRIVNVDCEYDVISEVYVEKIDGIKYCLTQRGAVVVGYDENLEGSINIPDKVEINRKIFDVVGISNYAFFNCLGLTHVKLNEGMESIGKWAFVGCENLLNIELPDSLLEIGEQAFADCKGLKEITIPGNVEYVGVYSLADCENLEKVTLKDGVKYIGALAFSGCQRLRTLEIPNSLKVIYRQALLGCKSLETPKLPNGKMFFDCSGVLVDDDLVKTSEKPKGIIYVLTFEEYCVNFVRAYD